MKMEHVLFDLDGTLIDSYEGITNAAAYALHHYGIEVEDRNVLRPFIGPPLDDSFMRFYGFSREQAWEAVEKYREYFREKGVHEYRVYEGMAELLERLHAKGVKLYLASSKPTTFVKVILEEQRLMHLFTDVQGANLDGTRMGKEEVLADVLRENGVTEALIADGKAAMVGDRKFDMIGAKSLGLTAVGVLFGFGSAEELTEAGADFLAKNTGELFDFLV